MIVCGIQKLKRGLWIMQNRVIKVLFLVFLSMIIVFGFNTSQKVNAAENKDQVMLVYDSENTTDKGNKKIDALQRVLTSMNLKVRTLSQSKYKSGMLTKKYLGIISMVNWDQVGFVNKSFIKDRNNFSGIKLHIGNNISKDEVSSLGAKSSKLYQQQLTLKNKGSSQILPFSETITVLTDLPDGSQTIGVLNTQQPDLKTYGYGIINGKNGYLPYFDSTGLSYLTAVEMISKLFAKQGSFLPMLTITGVSPISDLKMLDKVSEFCYKNKIPFAISTTSVADNTGMKAFTRFTSELRNIENRGGIIFIKSPEVAGSGNNSSELRQVLTSYIVSLAKDKVYPVGISTDGFWNQDKILRKNFLMSADHWILLPNSNVTYLKQDNRSQIADMSYLGIKASSLKDVKKSAKTKFTTPTAILFPLPGSNVELASFKEEINKFVWFNPKKAGMTTAISTGTSTVSFKNGDYFVNGKKENIDTANSSSVFNKTIKKKAVLKNYFNVQGNVLMILFAVITIILIIFILLGRRIYWNGFNKRK